MSGLVFGEVVDVMAETYSIYVDAGADDDGDGSKEKPFKEVKDAVEESKSGDNIYIYAGTYDGSFKIPASVGLFGQSRDKVKIKGTVTAANGSSVKDLTISGGAAALTVESGATVSVKKCIIRDATKTGIDVQPGNGKLTVENTKITNNNKGIYAQKGNQLKVSGSTITKNKEEGIDIRNKVDGSITGNEISNNGESGIEIILGSSDMNIVNNAINSNSASGIAAQFYADFSKKGKVKVDDNKIKNNNHYGIKCGAPSEGNETKRYWEKSLNLNGNVFGGNDEGDIAGRCRITLDDESDEKVKENAAAAEEKEKTEPIDKADLSEEDAEAIVQAEREFVESMRNEAGLLQQEIIYNQEEINKNKSNLEKRYSFFYLIFGPNQEVVSESESNLLIYGEKLSRLREIYSEISDENLKNELNSAIASFEGDILEKENTINNAKNSLGFWYRLKNMFEFSF